MVLSCWKLEGQRVVIGLLLSALSPFKMILFWGLKKTPLLLENPALKDHLMGEVFGEQAVHGLRDDERWGAPYAI